MLADLQPYICTFSTCKDALVKFPTRKMWVDHEFDEHRVNRSWVCPDCSAESFSSDAWDEHLRQEHNITFEGSQHAIALDSARRITSKPIDEQQCRLCKAIPGSTRRAFSTHVGRHMEQIALVVLPRETEDGLEGSSDASDLPIHGQQEGPSLGPDVVLSPNAESGSVNKTETSVFGDSETGHLADINSVIRDAGTASPFLGANTLSEVIERAEKWSAENQISTPDSADYSNMFLKPYNEHSQIAAASLIERPYKCPVPGCKKLSGFTYAGGLRRHEREVHSLHGGPTTLHMCPHAGCVRSTGSGFRRMKNLREHFRRAHTVMEDRPPKLGAKQDIPIDTDLPAPKLVSGTTHSSTQAMSLARTSLTDESRDMWGFDAEKDTKPD